LRAASLVPAWSLRIALDALAPSFQLYQPLFDLSDRPDLGQGKCWRRRLHSRLRMHAIMPKGCVASVNWLTSANLFLWPFDWRAEQAAALDLLAQLFGALPGAPVNETNSRPGIGEHFIADAFVHVDDEVV